MSKRIGWTLVVITLLGSVLTLDPPSWVAERLVPALKAQISVPFTFTAGTIIDPDQMNTNFSTIGNAALNRTGGVMSGTLQVLPGSTAAPGLSSNAQASTGLNMPSGSVRIDVAGVERGAFDTNGLTVVGNLNVPQGGASFLTGMSVAGSVIVDAAGRVDASRLQGTSAAINGSAITNLNASNLTTGTVATARLGGGTANNATFLRGDSTWGFPVFLRGISFIGATYTALPSDDVILAQGTFTITLYGCVNTASNSGRFLDIKNVSTGVVTIAAAAGEGIDESATQVLGVRYQALTLVCLTGSGWWIL